MPLGLFGRLSFRRSQKVDLRVVWQIRTAPPREKNWDWPIVPLDKVECPQADMALVSEEAAFLW